jgi:hypothetical protein
MSPHLLIIATQHVCCGLLIVFAVCSASCRMLARADYRPVVALGSLTSSSLVARPRTADVAYLTGCTITLRLRSCEAQASASYHVPAAKTTTIHFCIKYCYPGSGSAVAISAPHDLCPAFCQHRRDRQTAYVLQKCARIYCIPRHITARLSKRACCIELFVVLASSPRRVVSAAFYDSDRSTYAAPFSFGRQDSARPGIFGYTGPKGWLQSLFASVAVDNTLGAEHTLPTTVCLATPYHVAAKPPVHRTS